MPPRRHRTPGALLLGVSTEPQAGIETIIEGSVIFSPLLGYRPHAQDYSAADVDRHGRGGSLAADGDELTVSLWFKGVLEDATEQRVLDYGFTTGFFAAINAGSGGQAFLRVVDPTLGFTWAVLWNGSKNDSEWHHLAFSLDLAVPSADAYLDGAQYDTTLTALQSGHTIDFTVAAGLSVGAGANASRPLNGLVSEVFIDNQYTDLSSLANMRKFYGADGGPVDLGADGSGAFGSQPLVYLRDGEHVTNAGSVSDLTTLGTPTLTDEGPP